MLALQIYVPRSALPSALTVLSEHPGVTHVICVGESPAGDLTLVTADVDAGAVDALLPDLRAHGIAGDDIEVVHRESNRPLGVSGAGDVPSWSGGGIAWLELAMASRQYARAVPQYLVFMACAGIIAVFGVFTSNSILIVGAMAISPDLLPMCAVCVALTGRRPKRAARALAALTIGLGVATLATYVVALLLRVGGYGPANGSLGDGGLGVLPDVNVATVVVAFVAGVGGMLSFETRSSSAVGVAISITTIPAAAYVGAAAAVHDVDGADGAVAVLVVNVAMLILAGTLTLVGQRWWRSRHLDPTPRSATG